MNRSLPVPGAAEVAGTPGLGRRMACFVYEGLLLFGVGLVPGAIGALFTALTGRTHPLQSDTALRWIAFAIYGVYFVFFWSARGQTLPMQTWHIRVVTRSGARLSQSRALLRYLASCVWFAPAIVVAHANGWIGWSALAAVGVGIVGYALLARLHPERQFWHDVVCGTRLVTARDPPIVARRGGRSGDAPRQPTATPDRQP